MNDLGAGGSDAGATLERQSLADPVRDRAHLEPSPGRVGEQLVGGRALAELPELAQKVASVAAGEPVTPELGAEEVAHLRLERP